MTIKSHRSSGVLINKVEEKLYNDLVTQCMNKAYVYKKGVWWRSMFFVVYNSEWEVLNVRPAASPSKINQISSDMCENYMETHRNGSNVKFVHAHIVGSIFWIITWGSNTGTSGCHGSLSPVPILFQSQSCWISSYSMIFWECQVCLNYLYRF